MLFGHALEVVDELAMDCFLLLQDIGEREIAFAFCHQRVERIDATVVSRIPLAQDTGLTLLESDSVRVPTTIEDALQQLRLPQFHAPFLDSIPEDKRDALLLDAANTLQLKEVIVDSFRSWHFFVFKKIDRENHDG